jgi:hypothetical protein
MKKVSGVPDGELVVSVVIHDGRVLVATNKHVYIQGNDFIMRRVVFETEEKDEVLKGIKINTDDIKDIPFINKDPSEKWFASAKLYFYRINTSIDKPTYSDEDLTHALPNPVIADYNGEFPNIFVNPDDGSYRIMLTDGNGMAFLIKDYYVTNGE